jgi:hypothetical protein
MEAEMKRILLSGCAMSLWLLLCAFTPFGVPILPAGPQDHAFDFGLSLSGQTSPCFGCGSSGEEGCYQLGAQAYAGLRLHQGGQLRLKFSAQLAGAALSLGDHSDFAGNIYLDPGVEYMLSRDANRLAFLMGADLGIWKRNNRDEFEVLSVTPYIGGLLALRDPGQIRPYFQVRIGASVAPRRAFAGSLAAGVQFPLGESSRLSLDAFAGFMPGEGGVVPAAGGNLGLVF